MKKPRKQGDTARLKLWLPQELRDKIYAEKQRRKDAGEPGASCSAIVEEQIGHFLALGEKERQELIRQFRKRREGAGAA